MSLFSDDDDKPQKLTFEEFELEEFAEAFSLFDKDEDGKINYDQFEKVMKAIGQVFPETKTLAMFEKYDRDHTGLDFEKFLELLSSHMNRLDKREELRFAFRVFDKENNGFLTTAELTDILTKYGTPFNEDEMNAFIKQADISQNGVIDYDYLVDHMVDWMEHRAFKLEQKARKEAKARAMAEALKEQQVLKELEEEEAAQKKEET